MQRCEQCGQPFFSDWSLKRHMETHQPRGQSADVTITIHPTGYIDCTIDVHELSVDEMATLNGMKYTNPEWLERYG